MMMMRRIVSAAVGSNFGKKNSDGESLGEVAAGLHFLPLMIDKSLLSQEVDGNPRKLQCQVYLRVGTFLCGSSQVTVCSEPEQARLS